MYEKLENLTDLSLINYNFVLRYPDTDDRSSVEGYLQGTKLPLRGPQMWVFIVEIFAEQN